MRKRCSCSCWKRQICPHFSYQRKELRYDFSKCSSNTKILSYTAKNFETKSMSFTNSECLEHMASCVNPQRSDTVLAVCCIVNRQREFSYTQNRTKGPVCGRFRGFHNHFQAFQMCARCDIIQTDFDMVVSRAEAEWNIGLFGGM